MLIVPKFRSQLGQGLTNFDWHGRCWAVTSEERIMRKVPASSTCTLARASACTLIVVSGLGCGSTRSDVESMVDANVSDSDVLDAGRPPDSDLEPDEDGDGFSVREDCNDSDSTVHLPNDTYDGSLFGDDVETFCDSYCERRVSGDVRVTSSDLVSLLPLRCVTEVTGHLSISTNEHLATLDGLERLARVGSISVYGNPELKDVDALGALTETAGGVAVESNATLETLSGLRNIGVIGGDLSISQNGVLENLAGLDALTSVGADLVIRDNPSLRAVTGLEALTEVTGELNILGNPQLSDIQGLHALADVGERTSIYSNAALTDFRGLDSLVSIGGALEVEGNGALESLAGLGVLTTVAGSVTIHRNSELTTLDGLDVLQSIDGSLSVTDNDSLISVWALHTVASIRTSFDIYDNPRLPTSEAEALRDAIGVDHIGGRILIDGNAPK